MLVPMLAVSFSSRPAGSVFRCPACSSRSVTSTSWNSARRLRTLTPGLRAPDSICERWATAIPVWRCSSLRLMGPLSSLSTAPMWGPPVGIVPSSFH